MSEKPHVSIGTYTITELYAGRSVENDFAVLLPADDLAGITTGDDLTSRASTDIGILISQIEALQDATGETLDPEDAAIVSQIKACWGGYHA